MARLFGIAALALALGLAVAAPASAADVSAEAGLVSDYRYRGISLSEGRPAAQASLTIEQESGLYLSAFASTIRDAEMAADIELDLTAGISGTFAKEWSLDLSLTYYAYPGEADANYLEASLVAEGEAGPALLSAGASFTPPQPGTRDESGKRQANIYLFAGVAHDARALPLTFSARLGHERGYFDEAERGGKWDWSLGAEASLGMARLGVQYVGTSLASSRHALIGSLFLDL